MPKKILIITGALPPKVAAAKDNDLVTKVEITHNLELALVNHSTQILCVEQRMQSYLNRQYARTSSVKPPDSDFFDCEVITINGIPSKGPAEIKKRFIMPSQAMVQQMSGGLIEQPA